MRHWDGINAYAAREPLSRWREWIHYTRPRTHARPYDPSQDRATRPEREHAHASTRITWAEADDAYRSFLASGGDGFSFARQFPAEAAVLAAGNRTDAARAAARDKARDWRNR